MHIFLCIFMASICLVIKCTLNPSSISVLQYLSCIFFCFLLIWFSFFFLFFFLFFAGECIPPRTTALAASTFNLYVSLASVDVNTFQVSCQPACSLPLPSLSSHTLPLFPIPLCLSSGQTLKQITKSARWKFHWVDLTFYFKLFFLRFPVLFLLPSSLLCTWEVCRTWNRLRKLREKPQQPVREGSEGRRVRGEL